MLSQKIKYVYLWTKGRGLIFQMFFMEVSQQE